MISVRNLYLPIMDLGFDVLCILDSQQPLQNLENSFADYRAPIT